MEARGAAGAHTPGPTQRTGARRSLSWRQCQWRHEWASANSGAGGPAGARPAASSTSRKRASCRGARGLGALPSLGLRGPRALGISSTISRAPCTRRRSLSAVRSIEASQKGTLALARWLRGRAAARSFCRCCYCTARGQQAPLTACASVRQVPLASAAQALAGGCAQRGAGGKTGPARAARRGALTRRQARAAVPTARAVARTADCSRLGHEPRLWQAGQPARLLVAPARAGPGAPTGGLEGGTRARPLEAAKDSAPEDSDWPKCSKGKELQGRGPRVSQERVGDAEEIV